MAAYWSARVTVTDPEQFAAYRERVPDIVADHGGTYVALGKFWVAEGSSDFDKFVVIRFASFDDAVGCYQSAAYQEASRLRGAAGRVEIVIVDGEPAQG